jgi:hypothetical protein
MAVSLDCVPNQSGNGADARRDMGQDIAQKLAELPTLSRKQLLDLWEQVYSKVAPRGIRREFLIPFLAYRLQENAYGGLKSSTRAELRRIAKGLEPSKGGCKRPAQVRIKSGTRIVRTWRGIAHEVFVAESSFEYQGVSYRSLSEIARKITGTRWSGPAFFGLKKRVFGGSAADGQ